MDTSLFCPECHNLLDLPGDEEFVVCSVCGAKQSATLFEGKPFVTHTRKDVFGPNPLIQAAEKKEKEKKHGHGHGEGSKGTGATIKERCPKCGNPEMTFHTMQLRSADEGQTVFYTCPKCR